MKAFTRIARWSGLVATSVMLASGNLGAQTTLFFEGFEQAFPDPWRVGDYEPEGDPAWWADVQATGSVQPRTGGWMGYCAGFGNAGTVFAPRYQSDMYSYMERDVNLASQANPVLTFWINIPSIEESIDSCEVWMDNTTLIWIRTTPTVGWEQVTLDLSAWVGQQRIIGFWFFSDFSVEFEGWYLDDIRLTVSGPPQPNLTPYQRPGYNDKLIVSKVSGTATDDTNFQPSDPVYVDWAVVNNGQAAVSTTFTVELLVDDAVRRTWTLSGGLPVNSFAFDTDFNVGPLAAGTHNIKIRADAGGAVSESNEADNEYSKSIVVTGSPDIRITPLTLELTVTNSGTGGNGFMTTALKEDAVATPEQKLTAAHEVLEQLDQGVDEVHVIVSLVPPPGKPRTGEWDQIPRLRAWQRTVKDRQDEVLATMAPDEFEPRHILENQSAFSGLVSRKGLAKLARHPRVESIHLSRTVEANLAQGIPLMNAALYRPSYNGSGVAIAIVDSGVDYNHPRLGGGGFPNSKVIGGYDFGDSDADPIPLGNAHGTACAGIAAGDLGTVGDYIGGVAPNAKIYALKVTPGSSESGSDANILAAWDWCISHKNDDPDNPILVISTSFGGGRNYSECDDSQAPHARAAADAADAGITLLASSGNSGYCDSIGAPACLSGVIGVGAVFDANFGTSTYCLTAESCAPKYPSGVCPTGWATDHATGPDVVTRYSNTAPFLDVLAPSHQAYTTDIVGNQGYNTTDYVPNFGGTSAACPYAAGAVAALQSAARSTLGHLLTPVEVRALLTITGDPVTDPKASDITIPRINLGKAIEALGQTASFTIFNDGNAPLDVTSITPDTLAPWIELTATPPFTIPPGAARVVGVSIDPALVPIGSTTRRLLVASNDGDENPYPNGVFITVNGVGGGPKLTGAIFNNNRAVISWPTNEASGYILQWVHAIPATVWSNVPAIPVTVGTNHYVTNTIAPGGKKFYRLRK